MTLGRAARGALLALCVAGLTAQAAGPAWAAEPAWAAGSEPETIGGARLDRRAFSDLPGWTADDHLAALRTFGRSCAALTAEVEGGLQAACARRPTVAETPEDARAFFETWFEPFEVVPAAGQGFLTGYFEPEYEGSLEPAPGFAAALLARPDDLVPVPAGKTLPGLDPGRLDPELWAAGRAAVRPTPDGFEPYPDRAAIEDGAISARTRAIAYLREPAEAFIVQVQGSARLRLADGRVVRVAYDGRNGHRYTSVGKLLVEGGQIPRAEMSLERLMAWLKANPEPARDLMRQNRSFVFFRVARELDPSDGPVGGAGHPLTPGRSLAVDRTLWSYGLPVWLEGKLPTAGGGTEPLRRLMVAQDTGGAILGPARADFFFGTGPEAGTLAGLLGHPVRFVVLRPRALSPRAAP